jgi:hypothetical protein
MRCEQGPLLLWTPSFPLFSRLLYHLVKDTRQALEGILVLVSRVSV